MAFGVGSPQRRAVFLVAMVALAGSPAAMADNQPPPVPPSNSGISQYVEQVPSSGGSQAPGVTKARTTKLSKHIENKVKREGKGDARLLNEVATSSALGAPTHTTRTASKPKSVNPKNTPSRSTSARSVALAAHDASPSSSPTRTPLFVAIAVALAATLLLAAWRIRAKRRPGPPIDS